MLQEILDILLTSQDAFLGQGDAAGAQRLARGRTPAESPARPPGYLTSIP
jgi:hypothetical protein